MFIIYSPTWKGLWYNMSRKLYCTVSGQSPLLYHQLFLFFLDAGPLPAIFFARISTFPPDFPPEKGRSDGEKTGFSPKIHRNGWKKRLFTALWKTMWKRWKGRIFPQRNTVCKRKGRCFCQKQRPQSFFQRFSAKSCFPQPQTQDAHGSFVIGHRTKFPEAEIVRLPVRAPDRRTAG